MEAAGQAVPLPKEVINRVCPLKVPLSTVKWNLRYLPTLQALVPTVHLLTTHMSQFSRYIILCESQAHPDFNLGLLLHQSFFYRVFFALCLPQNKANAIFERPMDELSDESLAQLLSLLETDQPADIIDLMEPDNLRTLATSLSSAKPPPPLADQRSCLYDLLVATYIDDYCAAADIEPRDYGTMSRIAEYAATQMVTAYKNNIRQNYGNYLRAAINKELRTKERALELERAMEGLGHSQSEIQAAKRAQIWNPASALKRAIAVRPIDHTGLDTEGLRVLDVLEPVLNAYDPGYQYNNAHKDLFYDIKAHPKNHFLAFVRLCQYFDQCATADLATRELAQAEARAAAGMDVVAPTVADDVTMADTLVPAVPALVVFGPLTKNQHKRLHRRRRRQAFNDRRGHQNHHQRQSNAQCEPQRAKVFQCCPLRTSFIPSHMHIDPIVLHSHFLKHNPNFTLATPPTKLWAEVIDLKSKPFDAREGLAFSGSMDTDGVSISLIFKHPEAQPTHGFSPRYIEDLAADSATDHRTPNCPYITSLSPEQVSAIRKRLVFNDMGRGDLNYMLGWASTDLNPRVLRYSHEQRLDETRMRKFTQLREIVKNEHSNSIAIREAELYLSHFHCTTLDPEEFLEYIAARAMVWDVLSDFYSNTMTTHTGSTHQVHSVNNHEPCNYPFHRKLRLSAYINQQQADARLKRNMIRKFGRRLVMVCGNWSASMARFHAPIRGRGWRKKFKKFGFPMYLFDEFRTSKTCPGCDGDLHKCKVIDNPRPYRRWQRHLTFCHGLLQCSNCLVKQLDDERNVIYKPRLYNRNLAATLNFRRIIQYYIRKGDIPPVFKHPTRVVAATSMTATPMPTPMPTTAMPTSSRGCSAARGRGAARAAVAVTAAPECTFSMTLRSARRSDLDSDVQTLFKRPRQGQP
ncbi:hypothetical protein GGH92_001199 [Coemansia sp. RSA 2673]|nr:hypothetical protein GGH92_001199 [Coemansia sp. RSA 2673]